MLHLNLISHLWTFHRASLQNLCIKLFVGRMNAQYINEIQLIHDCFDFCGRCQGGNANEKFLYSSTHLRRNSFQSSCGMDQGLLHISVWRRKFSLVKGQIIYENMNARHPAWIDSSRNQWPLRFDCDFWLHCQRVERWVMAALSLDSHNPWLASWHKCHVIRFGTQFIPHYLQQSARSSSIFHIRRQPPTSYRCMNSAHRLNQLNFDWKFYCADAKAITVSRNEICVTSETRELELKN